MTTELTLTLTTHVELPLEWKELVRGIAARHDFTATPRLVDEGIDVLLCHLEHGDNIRELAMRVGKEMEQALAQRSRFNPARAMNVFINHGQVAAFGPNAIAHGTAFQQQQEEHGQHLAVIRKEAKRIEQHASHLNAGLHHGWWQQYLPDKFRPAELEDAARRARATLAGHLDLMSNLDTLRATALAADAEADRILDGRARRLDRLHALVLRVLNSAAHVVSGIDRMRSSLDNQARR